MSLLIFYEATWEAVMASALWGHGECELVHLRLGRGDDPLSCICNVAELGAKAPRET